MIEGTTSPHSRHGIISVYCLVPAMGPKYQSMNIEQGPFELLPLINRIELFFTPKYLTTFDYENIYLRIAFQFFKVSY